MRPNTFGFISRVLLMNTVITQVSALWEVTGPTLVFHSVTWCFNDVADHSKNVFVFIFFFELHLIQCVTQRMGQTWGTKCRILQDVTVSGTLTS